MRVCNAEYSSLMFNAVGPAPSALYIDTHRGATGTRILKPCRSAGVRMGFVLLVIWRKPFSQMFSKTTRPDLAMPARICAP